MKLLSIDSDHKTAKGRSQGYLTAALFMAPHKMGRGNVCPHADNCERSCIFETGMGSAPNVRNARQKRRDFFDEWLFDDDENGFREQLFDELRRFEKKAKRLGLKAACRPNATSDIRWERIMPEMFTEFPEIQFYDYTKWPPGVREEELPSNYHLTYSWTPEWNKPRTTSVLHSGFTVAIPFAPDQGTWTMLARDYGPSVADREMQKIPKEHFGYPVVDGDEHDLIFTHPPGTIVGLRFKGKGGSRPYFKPGMFAQPY